MAATPGVQLTFEPQISRFNKPDGFVKNHISLLSEIRRFCDGVGG